MANEEDLRKIVSRKFIHLTTKGRRSGKSHTVELWFAVGNDKVYLSHEGEETDWMKNLEKNGQVTFEIGGKNFKGNARHLEDGTDEAWTGKSTLYEKYYGKATKEVIEDWFSLSKLLVIEALWKDVEGLRAKIPSSPDTDFSTRSIRQDRGR